MSSITETRYCISDHLLWSGRPSWAAAHPCYEHLCPDPTPPRDSFKDFRPRSPSYVDPAILLLPDELLREALLARETEEGQQILHVHQQVEIVVRTSLRADQRVDSPPAHHPTANATLGEQGVEGEGIAADSDGASFWAVTPVILPHQTAIRAVQPVAAGAGPGGDDLDLHQHLRVDEARDHQHRGSGGGPRRRTARRAPCRQPRCPRRGARTCGSARPRRGRSPRGPGRTTRPRRRPGPVRRASPGCWTTPSTVAVQPAVQAVSPTRTTREYPTTLLPGAAAAQPFDVSHGSPPGPRRG